MKKVKKKYLSPRLFQTKFSAFTDGKADFFF